MPDGIPARERIMNTASILLCAALVAGSVSGCSSRQLYNAGIGWRQNECQKMLDGADRARCLETANTGYDTYEKEKAAAGAK